MNLNDVHTIYHRLKRLANLSIAARFYSSCIAYIKAAAWWAYTFNLTFRDDALENLTYRLSQKIKKHPDYKADPTSVVFVDSYAQDHRGLTQQYIRAIMAQKMKLLFLTDSSADSACSQGIYKELSEYPKATILHIPNKNRLSGIKRAQYIYDEIIKAEASKIYLHLTPYAVEVLMAMHALPSGIDKYQINLTDHTFWLGATALDYSLEFRSWGVVASETGRRIERSKLLLCPYYPIIDDVPFGGFPFTKGKECVILSGGGAYKFTDEKCSFFHIMKRIMDENPELIWVHAGDDMDGIKRMVLSVMEETYLKRIYLIGVRDDIGEVFKHVDLYINSYPIEGGLMTLYAAHYGKPILSLLGEEGYSTNELVGQLQPVSLVLKSIDELCNEAHRLICDVEYRKQRGEYLKKCVIDEQQFNTLFGKLCKTNTNVLPIQECLDDVKLPSMAEKIVQETLYAGCRNTIIGFIKWRGILVPHCAKIALQYYPNKIKSVVTRNIKN